MKKLLLYTRNFCEVVL